ncbi:MAG: MFS transporter [Nibricoccus sp.]
MASTDYSIPRPKHNFRWVICGLLFCSVAVNYLDRLVLSILKKPLSAELGWSEADYGFITSAFYLAYAFGYLFGGRIVDRLGVKRGLPIFVFLWSCAAAGHGLCSLLGVKEIFAINHTWLLWAEKGSIVLTLTLPMTVAGFALARMALGLTEGGNFPGAIKTVAEWFPIKERALATGWFNAGTNVGAIVCPILVPALYAKFGWASTFYMTGATGFIWVALWWFLYDSPEKHRRLHPAELDYIKRGQPAVPEKPPARVPWLALLKYRAVWAYLLASLFAGPAWGFYQSFLPDFLDKRFHLSLQATGWWTGAFYALAAIGGIGGGWLTSKLLTQGWQLNSARKITLLICALSVVPVALAPFTNHIFLAVLIVGLAGSAHQGWSANLFSVVSDTMPRETVSSVVGLGGFLAFLMSSVMSAVTGLILQKSEGNYTPLFVYLSGMYLLSLLCIQLLIPKIEPKE